jgi:acyl-CoA reductase-like NAD-dependent aldehyde dehydrogenase
VSISTNSTSPAATRLSAFQDITRALTLAHALRAGTIWVNHWGATDAAQPFGGFKHSGIGRYLSRTRPRTLSQ